MRCAFTRIENVADLRPNPKNPKRHPRRQLEIYAKIIREQGWRRAIVISARSGLTVKGHGAYEAAREILGVEQVPVDVQDYASEEAEHADLLADNRLAELAENDDTLLAALLGELEGKIDLELAGIIADGADPLEAELARLDVKAPPKMAWVLVGIPLVRFAEINRHVEALAKLPGVFVETTASDMTPPEAVIADGH